MPKPRIYFTKNDNEIKMGLHGEKTMREIWENAGAKNITVHQRMAHTIGTCCMSDNFDSGVVDTECRSFEIANLYIADNSVFPGSLSANPALTIMANSLRIADLFLHKK